MLHLNKYNQDSLHMFGFFGAITKCAIKYFMKNVFKLPVKQTFSSKNNRSRCQTKRRFNNEDVIPTISRHAAY